MILDASLIYKEGFALSGGAAATDVLDHVKGGDPLTDEPMVVATVPVAAAGGTSVKLALQTADDSAFASPTTLYTTEAIPLAKLTLGAKAAAFRLPRGLKRYSRIYVTPTGTFTAGALNIFMVSGDQHSYREIEA